ncbi:amidohydrolase [Conexibacter woesei]|uniref:Amidohydrolase n=1 Tax=Conexibacter woesei (strain DSM 14684 / CCUG 47730 / CIP 108061 / JCM 11494 / NBRC 100937 / ID131577) TaxID=469383 RepID=D3F2M8_CONWI|nr:amidohydrolase [Conexibacter woesei]ADB52294.1 amidohydrolase [Conexibacter woesei DSM 14684]
MASIPPDPLAARLDAVASTVAPDVVAWRRHLHANPELSYEEHETARFIRERLGAIGGLEVTRPTPTSVMAVLRGGRPGPTLAIRSDHDALPIEEQTGLPFASRTPGVMHACGHDGHTAIALGAATVLASVSDELPGEIRFLFEHGEEALPGGASQLVAAGTMDGVDRVIGLHLWAWTPVGTIAIRPGRCMAACDVFRIVVHGRGGHISAPQEAVDPVAIGAQIVANLQHVVAREVDPQEVAIVGVTGFRAGGSVGVIPHTAELEGGTNVFSPAVQDLLERRIGEIAHGICAAHGAMCTYEYTRGYGAVVNDEATTAIVARTARMLLGDEAVAAGDVVLAGEDFSALQARAPGTFLFLGARNEARGIVHDHHHPRFDVDEDAFPIGVRLFAHAAVALLRDGAA